MMKRTVAIALGLSVGLISFADIHVVDRKVESFPVSQVRLTDGAFRRAQDADMRYMMQLDADRLLAPYRKEAGLNPKAENYTNWENTGLDGHIGGHYLSALAYMYAATGDKNVEKRLDYMLSELKICQDAAGDGYLCGVPGGRAVWEEIKRGDIRAGGFSLNDKWVPLYNIHKIFAGLRDAYLQAGREDAREMLVALTDWFGSVVGNLSDDQVQAMLVSEHGGLNEVFADVAAITGDEKYLRLAHRFSHNTVLQPLLEHHDKLTGMHANTQIPKVIGFKRIADLEHNREWDSAAGYFWDIVVNDRSISIGGNSVREHFHPSDDFSSMLKSEQGPETCNTYNMLRLTKMLYETSADPSFVDYYERALYNHILSSQNPENGGLVYFTPMRSGHYRVYSQPQTSFWCCVGSGLENHARYGEMIYGHNDEDLYVNLFIPSQLRWGDVTVTQSTAFPEEEGTGIKIETKRAKKFALKIRVPEWVDDDNVSLAVNGREEKFPVENGYAVLSRKWKNNDVVTMSLPMHLSVVGLPDKTPNYSFAYGPVILAADLGRVEEPGLYADDSRGGHIAAGRQLPLHEMPVIVGSDKELADRLVKDDSSPLTFHLNGVSPEKFEGMTLRPFYDMHERRYMVYWELISEDELISRREAQAEEERQRAALDAITADHVICGEQQPESDHFIEMTNTFAGNDEDRHWRKAGKDGWFAYRLNAGNAPSYKLRVEYEAHSTHSAVITVGGEELGLCDSAGGNGILVREFVIPADLIIDGTVNVRVHSGKSGETPKIYETRLIADKAV